ncbi:hypothetical protein AK812_SmicGene46806 [Symbiodinium microadriaticum]|uniref:Uncharacterized protein n=1 Tax=Symbiodinium microadriaticum TaxID=2951 RepID=A0A1Q9BT25_SYMMI|nr:hypothetical protein AK812_SmicGene46806 [Symbiodinium microadriaticum]
MGANGSVRQSKTAMSLWTASKPPSTAKNCLEVLAGAVFVFKLHKKVQGADAFEVTLKIPADLATAVQSDSTRSVQMPMPLLPPEQKEASLWNCHRQRDSGVGVMAFTARRVARSLGGVAALGSAAFVARSVPAQCTVLGLSAAAASP